jgi:hypothetical protein
MAAASAGHAAGQAAAPAEASKPVFAIAIGTPRSTVKSRSEVMVNIEVTNISGSATKLVGATPAVLGYAVDVRDSAGKPVPLTRRGTATVNQRFAAGDRAGRRFIGPGSVTDSTVPPGGVVKEELTVTDFFDLSRPGTYTIQVQRPDFRSQPPGSRMLKSNIIAITVAE